MKIRIKDNSVRLRLTRTEVNDLHDTGEVSAHTAFPGGGRFRYAVRRSAAATEVAASFADNSIVVSLPESLVRSWAESEQVSLHGEQAVGDGEMLSLLVEKDFACLAPRPGEDESDMFEHPKAGTEDC